MSAQRNRMLRALAEGGISTPQQAANATLDELWEIYGFGAAATYECHDWLAEHNLHNYELDDWIEARTQTEVGDPRKTRDPLDYTYDTQTQRLY